MITHRQDRLWRVALDGASITPIEPAVLPDKVVHILAEDGTQAYFPTEPLLVDLVHGATELEVYSDSRSHASWLLELGFRDQGRFWTRFVNHRSEALLTLLAESDLAAVVVSFSEPESPWRKAGLIWRGPVVIQNPPPGTRDAWRESALRYVGR